MLLANAVALVSTSACVLSHFDVDAAVGGGGSAGSAGSSPFGGGGVNVGGSGGLAGDMNNVSPPDLRDDTYYVLQGVELYRDASAGLLSNDSPVNLQVSSWANLDPLRPRVFDGELSVGKDGSFHFSPAPRFFGTYRFDYTAKNLAGVSKSAHVQIHVVPSDIELDAIVDGIGGYVLYGTGGEGLGGALDGAFDVNGDGRADLVVGAPLAKGGDGAAYVAFGKADLDSIDLEPLAAGSKEKRFVSLVAGAGEALGVSVAGLGDVDVDGVPDIAVGASGADGRAYVVSGASLTPRSVLPASGGYILGGDSANFEVGRVVRRVGDVNGDGVADLLVSSQNQSYGWLHVFFGGKGLSGSYTVTGTPGLHIHGAIADDGFPLAAAGVSDIDGDGAADVLASSASSIALLRGGSSFPVDVGSLGLDGSHGGWLLARGATGSAEVAGLSDINGDGTADLTYCDGSAACMVVLGPPSTLAQGSVVSGFAANARPTYVAGGTDVDGDGLSDLLFADSRRAYLVYGNAAGLPDLRVDALGAAGFSVRAASAGSVTSIAMLGDANGDGFGDFAIGDDTADGGAGRVYVVWGVPSR